MVSDNYITPAELRAIANAAESLNSLWDLLTGGPKEGISVDTQSDITLNVYDVNGETLGEIKWADAGPAFYASATSDE